MEHRFNVRDNVKQRRKNETQNFSRPTGNVYYTTKIKEEKGGAVKFEDKKTETSVTLQNSEVKKISKDEYKSALEAKDAPATEKASEMKEAPENKEVKE